MALPHTIQNIKQWPQRLLSRLVNSQNKEKLERLRQDVEKAFTQHPEDTGETYLEHLWFTSKMAGRFLFTSAVIVLHGLFPFLCVRTASNQIERIYRIMKMRIPVKRREEIDKDIQKQARLIGHNGDARIAIVGGGFSGAMVLANLIRKANHPISIEWFDAGNTLGTGIAYSTKDSVHLLNVRAERMGAFPDKHDDFYKWLQTPEGKEKTAKIWPNSGEIHGESYVSRAIYGEYLRHIVQQSVQEAKNKEIKLRITHGTVIDAALYNGAAGQLLLTIERANLQQEVLVDALVLATGNLPPRSLGFQTGIVRNNAYYVEDIWNTGNQKIFPSKVGELSPDSEVVIIGTGLTMVDAVLTLRAAGYQGTITAISRHGILPQPHKHGHAYTAWEWVKAPTFAPKTALGLLQGIRAEVERAERSGHDWRSVIDSLRPATQTLWKQLSVKEKRRFLQKLGTFWNVHRHRMSGDIYAELKSMQQSGALKIVAGKIYYVGSDKEGLTVSYRKRGTNRLETLRPSLVLNCTGPEYDIASSDHALLKNLRDRELITVGPLRMGIELTDYGTAKGKASASLFPIGSILTGELLESTAVPELREQAATLAKNLLEQVGVLYNAEQRAQLIMGEAI